MEKEKEKKKNEETEITWRAAEYEHLEKGGSWYLIVGGTALVLLVIALWQKNFFFGIFILLAGIMVITFGNRRPDVLDFKLTREGCELGRGIFYKYDQMENFSLRSRPNRLDEIIFRKKTTFNPFVRIPVDSRTAERAKIFLVQKLPEIQYDGSLLDILIDFLGF
ncbi:MAG: hypothetical protein ABSF47_00490 [Minisyncoccia bacterium]|jgi:hypothetical protein